MQLLYALCRASKCKISWLPDGKASLWERKMTREQYEEKYPFMEETPKMQCASDVISTLEQLMEYHSKNSSKSSWHKEMAATAAELLGEVALYTLTTTTEPALSEVSFARLVTRHFARCGTTLTSLKDLLNIFVASRQLESSDESR